MVVAYLACYVAHGASNPMHMTLLHREVDGPHRTTVISMNSMVSQPAGALGAIVLASLADATSISTAMIVGGIVCALAAPLYLPAWWAERRRARPRSRDRCFRRSEATSARGLETPLRSDRDSGRRTGGTVAGRATVARDAPELAALPLPDAVLFDLDGTLIDTVETRIAAWLDALAEAGTPTTRERLAPLIGLDGRRLAREIAALAGSPIDDARAEAIDHRSGELYERRNRAPRPLPGVRELVAAIEAGGRRWAIATSSRKAQVATSVAALGLEAEPTIVDASNVEHAKPEPDLLLLAARQLGVDPGRCWYVGDSTWDMVAAVAAGMIAIGVTAGAAVDDAALRGAGAAVVIGSLDELAEVLAPD